MPDHAHSSDPAVQAQLDRLWSLSPGADILGLERITALLARLGNPHRALPPVFHVAGTNGKGSTCAFLRAAIEAAGYRCHVYSSPHLVRFNERIRLAGTLIDDAMLAPLLAEVLDAGGDIGASFFEVTTAAAFLAFSRVPADACVIEVGLGGRLDATNVVPDPVVTGIAQLGIDHQQFLGETIEQIAGEKAGIAKRDVPLVTMHYPTSVASNVTRVAGATGAPVFAAEKTWFWSASADGVLYRDDDGSVLLPSPALAGAHQSGNLALATAMLRHQKALNIPDEAIMSASTGARWPARMQRLGEGPLARLLPPGTAIWLDGGHNAAAGVALAESIGALPPHGPIHLVVGMLANKDVTGLLGPIAPLAASLTAVSIGGHASHPPEHVAAVARGLGLVADTASDLPAALRNITTDAPFTVLIVGSLYLAGEVLAANDEAPS